MDRPTTWNGRRLALSVSAGVLLIGFLGVAVWRTWQLSRSPLAMMDTQSAAADPRLTFPTPYRNVRPEVRYVGDSTCAQCHGAIAESYRHHSMGRSLAAASEAAPVELY